jgi:hypothetical protein
MSFIKNEAVIGFPFELLDAQGVAITSGTVTGYYLIDGGAQTALTGTATHEGNGQWSWDTIPATAMDGDLIGLLFLHASGRASFTIRTTTAPYGTLIAGTPSEVELCNLALLDLGAAPIESLLDDSDNALLCRHVYPDARDELLALIQPQAAIRRTLLAATTAPTFGYTYAFALPTGTLLPLETDDESIRWEREGNTIVTDTTPIYLRYIWRLEDVTKFPQGFKRALIACLVARLTWPITKSAALKELNYKLYKSALDEAHVEEGQEGSAVIIHTTTLTTDVRG